MMRTRLGGFTAAPAAVGAALDALRERYEVPAAFGAEALAEAEAAAAAWNDDGPARLLAEGASDARDLPLVTIDPPGSMDLDQAVLLERLPARDGAGAGGPEASGDPAGQAGRTAPGTPTPHRGRSTAAGDLTTGTPSEPSVPSVPSVPSALPVLPVLPELPAPSARYRVTYAIASLGTFVAPGGALDAELRRRGETVYAPDRATPLHPEVLSHGAASLLPGRDRPACLWTIHLDATGEVVDSHVERALVRSRERLTYAEVQAAVDGTGSLPGTVPADLPELLAEIGRLRQEREVVRGGVSLRTPEQEIEEVVAGDGGRAGYRLVFRATLEVEEWNAQISLLTGMCAAQVMLDAAVGILRTMPPATDEDLARLHRVARALGVEWPDGVSYPELVRGLRSAVPAQAAFLDRAAELFRGAGYLAFGVPPAGDEAGGQVGGRTEAGGEVGGRAEAGGQAGGDAAVRPVGVVVPPPAGKAALHGAIAAPYAHVTAPLRRLVDRYGEEVCLAACAGKPVPEWVRAALPDLPTVMSATGRVGRSVANGALAALEALVLNGHVGQVFDGVITSVRKGQGEVVLAEPAVVGTVRANGERVGEGLPAGAAQGEGPADGDGDGDGDGEHASHANHTNHAGAVTGRGEGSDRAGAGTGLGGRLPVGERVRVRLVEADPTSGTVRFELA